MSTLALIEPGAALRANKTAVEIQVMGQHVRTLPVHHIDRLLVMGDAEISAKARRLLLSGGVSILYLDRKGRFLGVCEPHESRNGRRRRRQLQAMEDPARRLAFASAVVQGKLQNQRSVLLRRQRRLKDAELGQALVNLQLQVQAAAKAPNIETLRGVEGQGAALFFFAFERALVHQELAFEGRSHRPPLDPVNACLSFGYTLLLGRVIHACWRGGLDPYVGALHEAGRGAPELALDLIEEFRPLVDRLVLTLVNRRQLGPQDFRVPPAQELGGQDNPKACYLTPLGIRILIASFEEAMRQRSPHPISGESWTLGELIQEQAKQLARWVDCRVPVYTPITLAD